MKCVTCKSSLIEVDTNTTEIALFLLGSDKTYEGKVIREMNISKNGCLSFSFCPRCGRIRGEFPLDHITKVPWQDIEGFIADGEYSECG